MQTVLQDLRYACRTMIKARGFSAINQPSEVRSAEDFGAEALSDRLTGVGALSWAEPLSLFSLRAFGVFYMSLGIGFAVPVNTNAWNRIRYTLLAAVYDRAPFVVSSPNHSLAVPREPMWRHCVYLPGDAAALAWYAATRWRRDA